MKRRHFISAALSSLLLPYQTRLWADETGNKQPALYKTAYISNSIFTQHHISPDHPESPDRIRQINDAVARSGLWQQLVKVGLRPDAERWLKTVHTEQHIAAIRENTPTAHKVAVAAVGAVLAAVDKVVDGQVNNAFCATRPPGHHALNTGREEGFCYYNSIAIAARYAQQKYGLKKILIIDWDYHHGNATEATFYDDPDVLFFSTHDQYAYPGTGSPARQGSGKGLGYNINVHLPCGSGDENIIDAFNAKLIPAAEAFKPEMVFISAGFDSRQDDLLGCFNITDTGFAELTRIAMQIADRHCQGRVVSMLEGGYNLEGTVSATLAHISTLLNTPHVACESPPAI